MILLTDGVGTWNPALIGVAVAQRITIYTIGLGSGVDEPQLQSIATGTGGQYFHVANAADLPDVFREIDDEIDGGKDTDEDGLTDCEEEKGVHDSTSFDLVFTSDPRVKDTDGDGLDDGDEVNVDDRFKSGDVFLYPVFWTRGPSTPRATASTTPPRPTRAPARARTRRTAMGSATSTSSNSAPIRSRSTRTSTAMATGRSTLTGRAASTRSCRPRS